MDEKKLSDLIIKKISKFNLEYLINIINNKNGICFSCKHYGWLEPSWKHSFWGCDISTFEFDENYKCRMEKFEPNKKFLRELTK